MRTLARLVRRDDGSVAVIAGAAIATAVGIAAFTIDLSNAYSVQGRLQNAADAAALAAAQTLSRSEEDARALALDFAQRNVSAADGTVATTADVSFGQYDPKAGAFTPAATPYNAVKVVTRRGVASGNPVETYFGGIFGVSTIDVEADAIAVLMEPGACVFALDPSASNAFTATGGGSVRVPNCGIQVDSKAPDALTAAGASSIAAQSICVAGGYSGRNISATPDPKCRLKPDPLAGLPEPPRPTSCDMTDATIETATVLPAGKYCGTINITSNASVTLESGVFFFENALFLVEGSAEIEGSEVLLYFDEDSTFRLTSSRALRLTPPSTGPWHGVSIFQSRAGAATQHGVITGDREVHVGGAIYVPRMDLEMTGNSTLHTGIESGYVISNTFKFNGSSEAVFDMRGRAMPTGLAVTTALVE
jgi:hypothetical protein